MTDDMYLKFAIELFENGTWSKEVFIKKITLYAKEKNMNMMIIDEIINKLTNQKEDTIEEKKKFLSNVTFAGDELKYGSAALEMPDQMVEKFYEMEKETVDKFESEVNVSDVIEDKKEEKVQEEIIEDAIGEDMVPEFFLGNEPVEEKIIIIDNNTKLFGDKSINDIILGNYSVEDIFGSSDVEREERFNYLVQNVKVENLRDVANSLMKKVEPSYCLKFTIEWEKSHKDELKKEEESENSEVIDVSSDTKEKDMGDEVALNLMDIVGAEPSLPETEEEFVRQAEIITNTEKDSDFRLAVISNERSELLKKNKRKTINYFLKTAITITAVTLLTPVGGYLVFSNMIKSGKFNPENPVGKAIKSVVEKVMYMGMTNEEIKNERGKSK